MPDLPPPAPRIVSVVGLWREHHQEIKLRALDWKFYQDQRWEVKVGDLYCLTRHGQALFEIAGFGAESLLMKTLVSDEGEESPDSQRLHPAEFQHGGFAEKRVHIPPWIWGVVADAHGLQLVRDTLITENSN